MLVTKFYNNSTCICFGSRNKPIAPFEINTSKGKLSVSEINSIESCSKEELYDISKFFIDNFMESSTNPGWNVYKNPANKDLYGKKLKAYENALIDIFAKDDGNTTFLIAKDINNKVGAGVLAYSYKEIKGLEDPKTFFIRSVAVDKKYRRNNIATILMNKTLDTTKGIFTDALLNAYNKAVPLYLKLGFKKPNMRNPVVKIVADRVCEHCSSVPRYSKFMTKILDKNSTRWWKRFFKKIQSSPFV